MPDPTYVIQRRLRIPAEVERYASPSWKPVVPYVKGQHYRKTGIQRHFNARLDAERRANALRRRWGGTYEYRVVEVA